MCAFYASPADPQQIRSRSTGSTDFCEPQNRTRMLPKNWSSTAPWRLSELRQNPHALFMIPHVYLQNSTHILLLAEAFGFAADVRKSKICRANYYKEWCGFKPCKCACTCVGLALAVLTHCLLPDRSAIAFVRESQKAGNGRAPTGHWKDIAEMKPQDTYSALKALPDLRCFGGRSCFCGRSC